MNSINSQIKSGYNISDKKIFFGIKNEVANAYKQIRGNGIDFNKESITMFINYRLIGTIVHELTHSLQYYKCLNKIDDFETFLLGYGLNKNIILLNNNKQLLNDGLTKYLLTIDSLETNEIYYLTVPNERMASITANTYEIEVSKYFDSKKYNKLNDTLKLKDLSYKTLNYDKLVPSAFIIDLIETVRNKYGLPTKFSNMEEIISFLNNKAIKQDLNLNDKLYYSLPISDEELIKLEIEKENLTEKIIK